jgi:hypothetical protein
MPVYKYKSFEQAEAHLKELLPADPFKRLLRLQALLAPLLPERKIQRGIFKFKTIEEANRHLSQ